jgi:hypothetical protein
MPTGNQEGQPFESTLERDLMYLLKFDLEVDRFVAQPVKIEYQDKEGNRHTYTPDLIVYYRNDIIKTIRENKTMLCEVKYKDDLCQNFREYHPKFRAAMQYAKKRGWVFRVFTETHIRTPYLANAKFLLPYLNNTYEKSMIDLVLKRIEDFREANAQDLIASIFIDKWNQAKLLPVVWHLVARRSIGTDLRQPLTMSSKLWRMYYE